MAIGRLLPGSLLKHAVESLVLGQISLAVLNDLTYQVITG
jgi:hypothetical protein